MIRVDIVVDGTPLDKGSDFSVRLNKVISDVEKINSASADYSYSFDLPSTPLNNRVLGYGNVLPVTGKFIRKHQCQLIAAGMVLFEGTLYISGFDESYKCNLVSIKKYSVDEIFGESTMYDIEWYIPYSGAPTENSVNANPSSDVFFPLVAYGVFEKDPVFSDEVADDYTDRLELDDSVRWYHETFYPSMNLLSTIRRCFEQKGYELQGDIFDDEVLKNIYMSTSVEASQPIDYNLANPKMGSVDLSIDWCNRINANTWAPRIVQELDYKYCMEVPYPARANLRNYDGQMPYQFEEIGFYNLFGEGATVTENINSYMFDPGEQCIVIPADGCYRIELEVSATLDTSFNNGKIKGLTKKWNLGTYPTVEEAEEEFNVGLNEMTPIEIQLVRNVLNDNNNIELIKGRHNRDWVEPLTAIGSRTNKDWDTCYPHEQLYWSRNPTNVEPPYNTVNDIGSERQNPNFFLGYMNKNGEMFSYDPWVSPNFICGFSTYLGATMAVQKNNESWYRGQTNHFNTMAKNNGYDFVETSGSTQTGKNANTYPSSPSNSVSVNGNTLAGHIYCAVWLNKNDVLTLNCVHRQWDLDSTMSSSYRNLYVTNVHADLKINSFTPRDYSYVYGRGLGYSSPSQFDTDLRIGNFMSSGVTMASFVNNFISSFNLSYTQEGNVVTLNRNKLYEDASRNLVDIDKKASWKDAKSEKIEFKKEIGVKLSTNKDSWGFWTTVPYEAQNLYNWYEHGDYGYDIVTLDPDSTSSNVITSQYSYNYYQPFTLHEYNPQGVQSGTTILNLPVIGDYSLLAPGASYGDAMKSDCLDKTLRLWFRPSTSTGKSVKITNENEYVELYVPVGVYNGTDLSYHDSDTSLLKRYFNIFTDMRKDVVEIEVYLTPAEFKAISDGADCKFDGNRYRVLEVGGFDPSMREPSTLKLISR